MTIGSAITVSAAAFFLLGCAMSAFATPWLPFAQRRFLRNIRVRLQTWPIGGLLVALVCAVTIAVAAFGIGAAGGAFNESASLQEFGPGLSRKPIDLGIGILFLAVGFAAIFIPVLLLPLCFHVIRDFSYRAAWRLAGVGGMVNIVLAPEGCQIHRHDAAWTFVRNALAVDRGRRTSVYDDAISALSSETRGVPWAATLQELQQPRGSRHIQHIEDALSDGDAQEAMDALACLHLLSRAIPPYTPLSRRPTEGIGISNRMRWSSRTRVKQLRAEFAWSLPSVAADAPACAALAGKIREQLENGILDRYTRGVAYDLLLVFKGAAREETLTWASARGPSSLVETLTAGEELDNEELPVEELIPLALLKQDEAPPSDRSLARFMLATLGRPLRVVLVFLLILVPACAGIMAIGGGSGWSFLLGLFAFIAGIATIARRSRSRNRTRLKAFAETYRLDRDDVRRIYLLAAPTTPDVDRALERLGV